MPKFIDAAGATQDVTLDASVYRAAHDANMTVPQYINNLFPTNAAANGTAFEQMCAESGLVMTKDRQFGLRPPTLSAVLEGKAAINAGAITKDAQPASRILFPAVFLEMLEATLQPDLNMNPDQLNAMIAIDDTIAGSRFEQPVIDFGAAVQDSPMNARSQRISQLALPAAMISITASDIARSIPTYSLGLEISDEAAKLTTLDFVTLALNRQVAVERNARALDYMATLYGGDLDMGQAALTAATTTSYDAAATGGVVTQKSWLKFLNHNATKRKIDWIICDIDSYLKIEARTGRPGLTAFDPGLPRLEAHATVMNQLFGDVKVFLVPSATDGGPLPASTVVGLDSRYAIRRVRNSEATYSAVEEFVMRRSKALRFDFGEVIYRLYDEAWDVLTIA